MLECDSYAYRPGSSDVTVAYLGEDHGGDLLGGEGVDTVEVVNLNLGVAGTIVNNLEGPRLLILLDGGVVDAATDKTPGGALVRLLSLRLRY